MTNLFMCGLMKHRCGEAGNAARHAGISAAVMFWFVKTVFMFVE